MTLLPCPFCGYATVHIVNVSPMNSHFIVACFWCGARMFGNDSKERAIAAWNRRTPVKGASHE